ncbi:hypothetical protein G3480_14875 [Thiorhodococcus mannitoliphagus]|uniref:Uncharacterized protein n=1 Tax=Thiorhodococcus mannitoliphagus TaxID=329406 RepID=A0A6P1DTZ4_9GAMM|nr:hypothetical protein [Thiorhodococcus mannitoliphagus]NEX21578.1 hypothetical protein [Thiorhodococcus mannitoliphagus]
MGADNRGELKLLAVAILVAMLLLVVIIAVFLPATVPVLEAMGEGMSIKQAVPWGFGVTVALFIVFAVVAGDGLIGELQFMLGSFFSFFLILTLLIAWVF